MGAILDVMGAFLSHLWIVGEARQCRLARSGTIGSADLAQDSSLGTSTMPKPPQTAPLRAQVAVMGAFLSLLWIVGEARQCRLARSGTIGSADLTQDSSLGTSTMPKPPQTAPLRAQVAPCGTQMAPSRHNGTQLIAFSHVCFSSRLGCIV